MTPDPGVRPAHSGAAAHGHGCFPGAAPPADAAAGAGRTAVPAPRRQVRPKEWPHTLRRSCTGLAKLTSAVMWGWAASAWLTAPCPVASPPWPLQLEGAAALLGVSLLWASGGPTLKFLFNQVCGRRVQSPGHPHPGLSQRARRLDWAVCQHHSHSRPVRPWRPPAWPSAALSSCQWASSAAPWTQSPAPQPTAGHPDALAAAPSPAASCSPAAQTPSRATTAGGAWTGTGCSRRAAARLRSAACTRCARMPVRRRRSGKSWRRRRRGSWAECPL
jgi:hypothetical protein